jgi:hypothetical protein
MATMAERRWRTGLDKLVEMKLSGWLASADHCRPDRPHGGGGGTPKWPDHIEGLHGGALLGGEEDGGTWQLERLAQALESSSSAQGRGDASYTRNLAEGEWWR